VPNKSLSATIENKMPIIGKIKKSLVSTSSSNKNKMVKNGSKHNDGKTHADFFFGGTIILCYRFFDQKHHLIPS
jgi:hypothetical protein